MCGIIDRISRAVVGKLIISPEERDENPFFFSKTSTKSKQKIILSQVKYEKCYTTEVSCYLSARHVFPFPFKFTHFSSSFSFSTVVTPSPDVLHDFNLGLMHIEREGQFCEIIFFDWIKTYETFLP